VLSIAFIAHDGETNWMEGVQLLAVYAILALGFYFLPAGSNSQRSDGDPTPNTQLPNVWELRVRSRWELGVDESASQPVLR